jgi:hypothetical protein
MASGSVTPFTSNPTGADGVPKAAKATNAMKSTSANTLNAFEIFDFFLPAGNVGDSRRTAIR